MYHCCGKCLRHRKTIPLPDACTILKSGVGADARAARPGAQTMRDFQRPRRKRTPPTSASVEKAIAIAM